MIGGGQLLGGLVILGGELGCVFAATAIIVRRWGPGRHGAISVLSHAVVATALILAIHVVPGALGILARGSVLGAAAIALLAAWVLARRTGGAPRARAPARPRAAESGNPASWLLALVALGLVAGFGLVYLRDVFGTAPLGIDALTFHLPGVASWLRTGSLWQIDQFVPQLANGNYPNNGDVLFLALVLPFKSALLVRAAMVPYLILTGVAIYATCCQLGASRATAVLFAVAPCAIPALTRPALVDTQTDTLMLFGFAAGGALLLRHGRGASTFDLVLAGLALGISFGTKWYAIPCVAAVLVIWVIARAVAATPRRLLAGQASLVALLVLLAGGFWLLRNLVESADPFFPLRIAPFGITVFDAPRDLVRQAGGFTVGHYLLSPHILRAYIFPALRDTVGWVGALIGLSALVAGGLALTRTRRTGLVSADGLVLTVALVAVVTAAIYVVTPYTAMGPLNLPAGTKDNTRYVMPAVVAAAPAAAWLVRRLGVWGLALEAGVIALIIPALSSSYHLTSAAPWITAAVLMLAIVCWRMNPLRPAMRGILLRPVPAYLLVLVALAGAGIWARDRFQYRPYAQSDSTLAWLLAHAPAGHRVGLAGLWSDGLPPIFPAFGPRLGNRVSYVGPFVRHMLQQYRSEAAFDRALRLGRYSVLIIGRGYPYPQPSVPAETWARAAGFAEAARSPRLVLLVRSRAA